MQITVATINIRNSQAEDGENSWRFRRNSLLKAIQSFDCDVIGVQEAMSDQLEFLLNGMPGYGFVGVGRIDGIAEGEFAPILYRRSRMSLVDSNWFWLSETPEAPGSKSWDTACERMCTWADLRCDGGHARFMNTHLDHVSPHARANGAKLILERSADGPCVVMGDFNCLPADEPVQSFLEMGFEDPGAGEGTPTFHSWRQLLGERIDYVLGREVEFLSHKVVSEPFEGRDVSDHHPVVAEIRIPFASENT